MDAPTWTVRPSTHRSLARLARWQWSCTTQVPRGAEHVRTHHPKEA